MSNTSHSPAQLSISSRAWIELGLLALIWGGVFLAARLALDEVGVVTAVAHRTFWASLVLWGAVWWMRLPIPRSPRVWLAFLVMGLLNNIIPFSLLNWSQLHIESGLTSIYNATTAIFGVVVAAAFLADEQLTIRKAIGVLLGFIGVATAIGLDAFKHFDITSLAQLAAVAATLSYAFAGVWARKMLVGLSPQVSAAGMVTCSAMIAIPAAWFLEGPIQLNLTPVTWGALAYLSVAATAAAYLLYYRVLDMAGSGNLMLVTLMIPPLAILLGAIVLNESLSPKAFIGFGLLAFGLIVLDGRLLRVMFRSTKLSQ